MLKLHQLYLRKFIILFIILFITVGGILYYWVKDFYITQTKISLLHNIELVSYDIDTISHVENIASKIKQDLNIRLTVINQQGVVIVESHQDKENMDNHKYRDEIVESNSKEYGYIIRYSDTIKKDLLYVVKRYKKGDNYFYIRMSRELEKINEKILSLGVKIAIVLVVFFSSLFFLAYKMSTLLQYETNKILQFLIDLTKKRKNSYINSEFSHEFSQITKLLTKVSGVLTKKDKQKAKYTAKLKQSNNQKDDIISAISHEFKNPIAVINGYTQTLIDDKNINKKIQEKFLSKIYKSGIRLSDLIDTLRLSIKLDEGKQSLRYSEVKLREFLKENIENLQLNYKNKEIDLKIKEEVTLKIDETLFSIAVSNLIENALKYSQDKVTIVLDTNSISVIDKGIGIAKDDLEKITKKFYRVSNNGWNNSLGLGLSIVTNIVNTHNFSLDIQSVQNEGSTFTINF
ncbi:MAG: ATP-binding protein [Campylobacterota bacterium]|nr:ATP-binding protein [Campylobacterota bacterium]